MTKKQSSQESRQDGSYLVEPYKGYSVHGIIRRSSTFNTQRIDHIYQDPILKVKI